MFDDVLIKTQQLGERFLIIRMVRVAPDFAEQDARGMRIAKGMADKAKREARLREEGLAELKTLKENCRELPLPAITDEQMELVVQLANTLAAARTSPTGGTASQQEISNRVLQQLLNLGYSHCYADSRSEWTEAESQLVRRVVVDTLPKSRRRLLQAFFARGPHRAGMSLSRLAFVSRVDGGHLRPLLNQLMEVGFVEFTEEENEPCYRLTQQFYERVEKTKLFEGTHMPCARRTS